MAHEIVAEGNDNKSFLIPVPSQSSILRVSLFVKPMGRSVVFFMGAGNAVLGNTTGIPATMQNGAGTSTTPTGGGTTTSTTTSGLGDVEGLILSDTSSGTVMSGGTVATGGETTNQSNINSTDILLLIVAANLVSALLLGFAFFVIRHIVRTEVIIHEVKQLHRYTRYEAQRLADGSTVLSSPRKVGKREMPKIDRFEDLSEQDWEERINGKSGRSKIS